MSTKQKCNPIFMDRNQSWEQNICYTFIWLNNHFPPYIIKSTLLASELNFSNYYSVTVAVTKHVIHKHHLHSEGNIGTLTKGTPKWVSYLSQVSLVCILHTHVYARLYVVFHCCLVNTQRDSTDSQSRCTSEARSPQILGSVAVISLSVNRVFCTCSRPSFSSC